MSIFIALCTRTWTASISIALAVSICCSSKSGRQYYWLYHLFGWLVPICGAMIIYFASSMDRSKETPMLSTEKFGTIQIITSILVLALCVIISTFNLLRIVRRTYKVKRPERGSGWVVLSDNEDGRLINSEAEEENNRQRISIDRAYTGKCKPMISCREISIVFIQKWECWKRMRNYFGTTCW